MAIAKGSKILLADNTEKSVEDLKVGDLVWGVDSTNHIKPTKVLQIIKNNFEAVWKCGDCNITQSQELYVSNLHWHPKFRSFNKLTRKDATYMVRQWPSENIRKVDSNFFVYGYLRGFAEGDGHIGDGKIDKGIWVGQQLKPILEEFWNLYNDYISPCNINIHWDNNRGMYVGKGGYVKKFNKLTSFNKQNKEYQLGYLNGIIMADGSSCYNKSNGNYYINIAQSESANKEKCEKINYCLNNLNLKYHTWVTKNKGFKTEGSLMRGWNIPYAYKLCFKYGKDKKEKFLKDINIYNNLKLFPKTHINKTDKMNPINIVDVYDIKTEDSTYFCNSYLMRSV